MICQQIDHFSYRAKGCHILTHQDNSTNMPALRIIYKAKYTSRNFQNKMNQIIINHISLNKTNKKE